MPLSLVSCLAPARALSRPLAPLSLTMSCPSVALISTLSLSPESPCAPYVHMLRRHTNNAVKCVLTMQTCAADVQCEVG